MAALDVALEFVDRINRRDVDLLCELMTEDYRIEIEETIGSGNVVVLLGVASGTYTADGELHAENRWETPAAWKAVVRDDRVAEWRVWADLEPIRAVMRRLESPD